MNRITVEIYVPAAGRSFDVTIPENLPLRQVTELARRFPLGTVRRAVSGGRGQRSL